MWVGSGPIQRSVHSSQFTVDGLKTIWSGKVPSVHLNLSREIDSLCKFIREMIRLSYILELCNQLSSGILLSVWKDLEQKCLCKLNEFTSGQILIFALPELLQHFVFEPHTMYSLTMTANLFMCLSLLKNIVSFVRSETI